MLFNCIRRHSLDSSHKNITMQIDVTAVNAPQNWVACNLYTGDRCVKIYMANADYLELIRDGFFIRSGTVVDSAGVLNTTATYQKKSIKADSAFQTTGALQGSPASKSGPEAANSAQKPRKKPVERGV